MAGLFGLFSIPLFVNPHHYSYSVRHAHYFWITSQYNLPVGWGKSNPGFKHWSSPTLTYFRKNLFNYLVEHYGYVSSATPARISASSFVYYLYISLVVTRRLPFLSQTRTRARRLITKNGQRWYTEKHKRYRGPLHNIFNHVLVRDLLIYRPHLISKMLYSHSPHFMHIWLSAMLFFIQVFIHQKTIKLPGNLPITNYQSSEPPQPRIMMRNLRLLHQDFLSRCAEIQNVLCTVYVETSTTLFKSLQKEVSPAPFHSMLHFCTHRLGRALYALEASAQENAWPAQSRYKPH